MAARRVPGTNLKGKDAARKIRPQPGPQEAFLASPADIVIYGGSAGSGKSWGVLLEPIRHVVTNPEFASVFFRRNLTQIKNPGGLWDESVKLYPLCGGQPVAHVSEWRWPKGGKIKFAHLEYDSTVLDWQGAQIPLIVFDELTHFTQAQFWYMLSRNRSMCGVRPYIRATTNPDADSWVAELIAWWIDQATGLPILDRSGVVRWFIRLHDSIIWGDSSAELVEKYGNPNLAVDDLDQSVQPKSFTFIPAKLDDNPALMRADPGYRANLMALSRVERERLLYGNWKIRPAAGLLFQRAWCETVAALPVDIDFVRYWDRAATLKTSENDPDWTVGLKLGRQRSTGIYFLVEAIRMRESPGKVLAGMLNAATADGPSVRVGYPQDPGQAGKDQAQATTRHLSAFTSSSWIETGDKVTRFSPFSAQCEAGNVKILRGFSEDSLRNLEQFPDGRYKDDADACSGAYQMFNNVKGLALLDWARQQVEQLEKEKDCVKPPWQN